MLCALALYGSASRGDGNANSDIDLLGITEQGRIECKRKSFYVLSVYPWTILREMAQAGDLFAYHIVLEGKEIYDPTGRLTELKKLFRLKSDYRNHMAYALRLGQHILDIYGAGATGAAMVKSVYYCVRSTLIADLVFHPELDYSLKWLLSHSILDENARSALANGKYLGNISEPLVEAFRNFIIVYSQRLGEYQIQYDPSEESVINRKIREIAHNETVTPYVRG